MRDYEGDARTLLVNELGCAPGAVTREATLESLGADSLDVLELAMEVEDRFDTGDIPDSDFKAWTTFGDLVDYVEKRAKEA